MVTEGRRASGFDASFINQTPIIPCVGYSAEPRPAHTMKTEASTVERYLVRKAGRTSVLGVMSWKGKSPLGVLFKKEPLA
jgi:hypothetical protein